MQEKLNLFMPSVRVEKKPEQVVTRSGLLCLTSWRRHWHTLGESTIWTSFGGVNRVDSFFN